jgi:acyl-CoA synthetase (NDP forming)
MVGATPKRAAFWSNANAYITAVVKQGYQGAIYPVHPTAKTILGFQSYKRIIDIPGEIDLAVFTIPNNAVLQVMEDCVAKKVKFVHILTAGFSETGLEESVRLEKDLLQLAQKGGVRVIGPNCMGIYSPDGGVSWEESYPSKAGAVGFLSQSGQLAGQFVTQGIIMGLTFSKVVSFGNTSDLQPHDFLEYLGQDDKTEVIAGYLEGLKDGRAFLETAARVTRKKPLIIFKGGQTEGGARAILSHTASLAGSPVLWQGLCRQTGIIPVNTLLDAVCTAKAFQKITLPEGLRVGILGGGGGGSVTTADLAEKEGLEVPRLSEITRSALGNIVPTAGTSVNNPIDYISEKVEPFVKVIELLQDDPNVDAVILHNIPWRWLHDGMRNKAFYRYLGGLNAIAKEQRKPMVIVLETPTDSPPDPVMNFVRGFFSETSMATLPNFTTAARVIYNLHQYKKHLSFR